MNPLLAILTGSRVYGRPTESSDLDIVLQCDDETIESLKQVADSTTDYEESAHEETKLPSRIVEATFRFGRLNVICVKTDEQFAVWRTGTQKVKFYRDNNGPQTRELAVEVIQRYKREIMPCPNSASGSGEHSSAAKETASA